MPGAAGCSSIWTRRPCRWRDYLESAASILNPFQFDKMRYKWRQWVIFDCNWKTALEAFMEPYHVAGTHTQMLDPWRLLRL